jgi:hypothetical protein
MLAAQIAIWISGGLLPPKVKRKTPRVFYKLTLTLQPPDIPEEALKLCIKPWKATLSVSAGSQQQMHQLGRFDWNRSMCKPLPKNLPEKRQTQNVVN